MSTDSVLAAIFENSDNPSAFLAANSGNSHFTHPAAPGVIAYRTVGRHLVQFGGPFAPAAHRAQLLRRFGEFAAAGGRRVVAVQLQSSDTDTYAAAGYTVNQIGASYAVDLAEFTLRGSKFVKLRNKISVWDDLSTVYMAAQVLGYDKPDPSAIYNLNDQQLANVKKKLLELKPNIRKMWTQGGELTNLFENHEVVAAMGWPLMTNQLRSKNFPIGETIPKENTTGWIDHLMITSASRNKDLAEQFLEYMIQAKTQKAVCDVTGYTPANGTAGELMTGEQRKALHLDDVENYQKHIYFWQNVPRRAKYNEIWNEVKASQ